MHEIQRVEEILGRLMPAAMSEAGQEAIEQAIDGCAGASACAVRDRSHGWLWGGAGIAASIALAFLWGGADGGRSLPVRVAAIEDLPGLSLLGASNRLESMSDEGWMEDEDGAAMQAVRLNVVEENTVHDEETGIVMRISEPREEFLFMPVTTF